MTFYVGKKYTLENADWVDIIYFGWYGYTYKYKMILREMIWHTDTILIYFLIVIKKRKKIQQLKFLYMGHTYFLS